MAKLIGLQKLKKENRMLNKKEIKQNYKQSVRPMGVYAVKNNANGKIFLGSSKNIPGRINRFKFELKTGSNLNRTLLDDYKKYGEDNFSFEVLEYKNPKEDLTHDYTKELEEMLEKWIEKLQPFGDKGYN